MDAVANAAVDRATRVKMIGREVGFDLVRITSAAPLHQERTRYLEWLEQERQGGMAWMTPERAERSSEPASVLTSASSVIAVAMSYWSGHRPDGNGSLGKVARYAWGRDYHLELGERLECYAARLRSELGGDYKWYVDTGPAMDKALAARAGVGWYGKNTNLLTEEFGSWVLLGEIITTLQLPADEAFQRDCGSCRLCVIACPTGALGPDYTIDARRCISYLTIEHRAAIPRELRPSMSSWVYGCDICQDVCPPSMRPYLKDQEERKAWSREVRSLVTKKARGGNEGPVKYHVGCRPVRSPAEPTRRAGTRARPLRRYGRTEKSDVVVNEKSAIDAAGVRPKPTGPAKREFDPPSGVDLHWLLRLTHQEYVDTFRKSAIRRAKVWMLRRNAAVALGNVGDESSLRVLEEACIGDDHPLVRGHAAWAIGEIGRRCSAKGAPPILEAALSSESDPEAHEEIVEALRTCRP
ncbi:MAG TPA: tRNA epoxyqueuosine(34) reductase QueG [Chloroflexota bacterium]